MLLLLGAGDENFGNTYSYCELDGIHASGRNTTQRNDACRTLVELYCHYNNIFTILHTALKYYCPDQAISQLD